MIQCEYYSIPNPEIADLVESELQKLGYKRFGSNGWEVKRPLLFICVEKEYLFTDSSISNKSYKELDFIKNKNVVNTLFKKGDTVLLPRDISLIFNTKMKGIVHGNTNVIHQKGIIEDICTDNEVNYLISYEDFYKKTVKLCFYEKHFKKIDNLLSYSIQISSQEQYQHCLELIKLNSKFKITDLNYGYSKDWCYIVYNDCWQLSSIIQRNTSVIEYEDFIDCYFPESKDIKRVEDEVLLNRVSISINGNPNVSNKYINEIVRNCKSLGLVKHAQFHDLVHNQIETICEEVYNYYGNNDSLYVKVINHTDLRERTRCIYRKSQYAKAFYNETIIDSKEKEVVDEVLEPKIEQELVLKTNTCLLDKYVPSIPTIKENLKQKQTKFYF